MTQTENWYGFLKHADVILDSYPFGGYTTTLEAFAVGSTPIVTLPHSVCMHAISLPCAYPGR